ncbi:hypothetical protein AX16_006431 [Volvariella volvacea WC 439]|nr:hypothetical protein AX16_006431 [Volvariella volvacea WC 439]
MNHSTNHDTECPPTKHCTATAVTNLYPDILSHIFLLVAESVEWHYRRYVPQTSHVCGYWRAVALQTSLLWNRFIIRDRKFLKRPWTQERLERAKSAMLNITVHPSDGLTSEFIPDLYRVQSLKIDGNKSRTAWHLIQDILKPYTYEQNPNLRSLIVLYRRPFNQTDLTQLSFELFHNNLPNLVSIHLGGCLPDDWRFLTHFRSLKSLKLTGLEKFPSFEALSRIPHLEDLSVAFTKVMTPYDPKTVARFNSLRKFSFNDPTAAMTSYILGSIHLPSCTKIELECDGGTEKEYADLKPILAHFVTTGAPLLSTLPLHCMALADNWIAAIAPDGHKHLPSYCNCTSATEVVATSDGISIELDADSIAARTFVATNIILPLASYFNHRHTRYLLWSHVNTEPDVKLGLDHRFFSKMVELKVLDVVSDQAGFLDGMIHLQEEKGPTQEVLNSPNEQLSGKFSTLCDSLSPPSYCLSDVAPKIAALCPNLIALNVIHPDGMEIGVATPDVAFFNEVSDKLTRRKVLLGRPLEALCFHGFGELVESERVIFETVTQGVRFDMSDIEKIINQM